MSAAGAIAVNEPARERSFATGRAVELVYIASPSYSGSTLLTLLLNAHPAIATVGELKWGEIDLADYRCSCGTLLRDCAFWRAVAEEVEGRGLPFDLRRPETEFRLRHRPWVDRALRARLRSGGFERVRDLTVRALPGVDAGLQRVAAVNRAIIDAALRLQRGVVFVDGSKDPVRLKHLVETGRYRARVIQLVRDGRAVVASARKNQSAAPRQAALDWLRTHEQIDRLKDRLGAAAVMLLRYEDLCRSPAERLNEVFAFLGLPACDCTHFRAAPHHVLGNRMRLSSEERIVLDEGWRQSLTPADRAEFERVGGALNRAFGYA